MNSPRNTIELAGRTGYLRTVASGSTIYAGALVAQNSDGNAVPASDTAGLIVLGRAENSAEAGGHVHVMTGRYIYGNGSSGEALSVADIGKVAYVVDDATVGKAGGSNKIPAGVVLDVLDEGVAVAVGPEAVSAAGTSSSSSSSSSSSAS